LLDPSAAVHDYEGSTGEGVDENACVVSMPDDVEAVVGRVVKLEGPDLVGEGQVTDVFEVIAVADAVGEAGHVEVRNELAPQSCDVLRTLEKPGAVGADGGVELTWEAWPLAEFQEALDTFVVLFCKGANTPGAGFDLRAQTDEEDLEVIGE
jgi:hypothetical protein